MLKKAILVILLLSIPLFIFAETTTLKVRIFGRDEGLLINNRLVEDSWDFKYSVKSGQVNSGLLSEGPSLSYNSTIIEGVISLDHIHPILNAALKNDTKFTVDYINKKDGQEDDKTFKNCSIKSVKMVKNSINNTTSVIYTFRARAIL